MMESSQSLRSEEGWKRESGWEKTGLEWNMDSLILWDSYTKYLSYLFVCYKKVSITGTKRCIDNYVQTKCLQFFLLTPNIFMDSEISKEWSSQAKEANPHLKPPGLLDVSQSSRLLSLAPQMHCGPWPSPCPEDFLPFAFCSSMSDINGLYYNHRQRCVCPSTDEWVNKLSYSWTME